MGTDREAVRLVAQPLQEIEHRVARLEREGWPAGDEKALAPGIAVGAFGDRNDRNIIDAELGEDPSRLGQLPLPAVDQHQSGPHHAFSIRVFIRRAIKTATEYLSHHPALIHARTNR